MVFVGIDPLLQTQLLQDTQATVSMLAAQANPIIQIMHLPSEDYHWNTHQMQHGLKFDTAEAYLKLQLPDFRPSPYFMRRFSTASFEFLVTFGNEIYNPYCNPVQLHATVHVQVVIRSSCRQTYALAPVIYSRAFCTLIACI